MLEKRLFTDSPALTAVLPIRESFALPQGLGVRQSSGAFGQPRLPKRQRTGALQDADATKFGLLIFVFHLRVMPPQRVVAEVVRKIAPDRVDVVRVVLRVVEFEEEARALHAVVMALT